MPVLAREEYCVIWYKAAMQGHFQNLQVATRLMKQEDVEDAVGEHDRDFPGSTVSWIEREGMYKVATHHQKPILIDFAYEEGRKAVGYIIGLNSVTDYWDTDQHLLEDTRRERGGKLEAKECVQEKKEDPGFRTMKPYRDYACRLDGGAALVPIHQNFVSAWHRATALGKGIDKAMAIAEKEQRESAVPSALKRPSEAGDCSVQIIRTQPEEKDFSVRDVYFQATDIATMAAGYLYVETQYFQYEAWSRRLMDARERVMKRWKLGCAKAGKRMEDMPVMHVMIVIPVPERQGMVPRTYDALAVLGQHAGMTGQQEMIDKANSIADEQQYDAMGNPTSGNGATALDDIVTHANEIDKPTLQNLKDNFRMKISVAMLNTCGIENGRWRYREIYIHSKLMLVDDTFMTIGSANLNIRSMNVDSEINLATVNPALVKELRRNIWSSLSGKVTDGNQGTHADIKEASQKLAVLLSGNHGLKENSEKLVGFLLPLRDDRSSNLRLG
jgi:phosphatidylserine/phosphatidylglycerophosphate/cardiolipin synthase-like enzyme